MIQIHAQLRVTQDLLQACVVVQHRHALKPYKVGGQEIDLGALVPANRAAENVLLQNAEFILRDNWKLKDEIHKI
jgi:hypothetical protein